MSAAPNTEIVDIESLDPGSKIVAPNGKVWLILGNEPTNATEEFCRVRLIPDSPGSVEITRTYSRTTKFAVITG